MLYLKNVKIIEDKHDLLNQKHFALTANTMFNEPCDVQWVEILEDRLNRIKAKYVLAQVEMTVQGKDSKTPRYVRGYSIFMESHFLESLAKNMTDEPLV